MSFPFAKNGGNILSIERQAASQERLRSMELVMALVPDYTVSQPRRQ
jgi:hypothetical protein